MKETENSVFHFTLGNLEAQLNKVLGKGYAILRCRDYAQRKKTGTLPPRFLVLRVDADFSLTKAKPLGQIFNRLGVGGSFFVRLHAPEYNPFSFENYRVLRFLLGSGHEIGYHSEVVDQAAIWGQDPANCLRRDLRVLEQILDEPVVGVASHGGMTGLNNLDFWKKHHPEEFGLLYEAYDDREGFGLFRESLYISDSEWTRWKCYYRGELRPGDRRSLGEHLNENPERIYLLIHSDTYFREHFYE